MIDAAAKIMRDIYYGTVPVCEGKKVVGMITDRDIVLNVVTDSKDSNSVHRKTVLGTVFPGRIPLKRGIWFLGELK